MKQLHEIAIAGFVAAATERGKITAGFLSLCQPLRLHRPNAPMVSHKSSPAPGGDSPIDLVEANLSVRSRPFQDRNNPQTR